jgi:hypothetical protein
MRCCTPPGADPADKTKLEEAAKVIDSLEGSLSDPAQWCAIPSAPVFCPAVGECTADGMDMDMCMWMMCV